MRVVCALALFLFCVATAQTARDPEPAAAESPIPNPESRLSISLLTIGPGEVFFERFGHNAIVVRDPAGEESEAYNYGIFDFDQQDFLLNFARGRMLYRMAVDALDDDVAMYRDEGRQITEQNLNLTPEQARSLVTFLEWNAQPQNAQYRYDYFEANCSTRVRDALDRALGGALHAQSEGRSRGYTYRLDALRLMAPSPLLMLGIDLGLGPYADQRIDYWQESFVPATLSSVTGQVKLRAADGHEFPLVTSTAALSTGQVEEPPALPPDLRWPFLILGLALGVTLTWLGHSRRAAVRIPLAIFAGTFELFCGVGGAVLLFLWLYTEHRAAWRNENLLLLSPLCLLLVPAWFASMRANWRVRRMTIGIAWLVVLGAAFALFSKILPWFAQANLHWILLFLPMHVALAMVMQARSRSMVCTP
ncbi:MAG: DUF4105 domain-containing protein [Dokdonella sp.]